MVEQGVIERRADGRLQAKPFGRAATDEDFSQRSALDVVAGRAMMFEQGD
jgi:hypothetical protein